MGDLTKNISRYEIACPCCGQNFIDYEVVKAVQLACDFFELYNNTYKVVLKITSGNRCILHNQKVGSDITSQHLLGKAIDHKIIGVDHKDLYQYYTDTYRNKFGIGLYESFVHLDCRHSCARW